MASLGSLVAGISHEINTPLGVSITSASALHEELKTINHNFLNGSMKRSELENYMQHAEESFTILNQNLARASELVNTFKRIAVDQSQEAWQTINLHDYLDDILKSLHPKFIHRHIKIHNNSDRSLDLYTLPGALYQIFSNLIINSLLHAFEKEEEGEMILDARLDQDTIELHFSDNGKGMNEASLKRIFEPFFTTKRGMGGTGLGLHIVYNLVTANLNGKIKVNSTLGSGTTFTISLPIITEGKNSD